jgi:hypothetical protein
MKKRIGSKIYDTEKGIPVLPEKGLYKQPKKRTFYLFDGKQITPISFDEAAEMIKGAGDPNAEAFLEVKSSDRGCVSCTITVEHYNKLQKYALSRGRSMKSIIEAYIDSLPEA